MWGYMVCNVAVLPIMFLGDCRLQQQDQHHCWQEASAHAGSLAQQHPFEAVRDVRGVRVEHDARARLKGLGGPVQLHHEKVTLMLPPFVTQA